MALRLCLQRLSNEEIHEQIHEHYKDSGFQPRDVALAFAEERARAEDGRGSPWWESEENRCRLAECRSGIRGLEEFYEDGEAEGLEMAPPDSPRTYEATGLLAGGRLGPCGRGPEDQI